MRTITDTRMASPWVGIRGMSLCNNEQGPPIPPVGKDPAKGASRKVENWQSSKRQALKMRETWLKRARQENGELQKAKELSLKDLTAGLYNARERRGNLPQGGALRDRMKQITLSKQNVCDKAAVSTQHYLVNCLYNVNLTLY